MYARRRDRRAHLARAQNLGRVQLALLHLAHLRCGVLDEKEADLRGFRDVLAPVVARIPSFSNLWFRLQGLGFGVKGAGPGAQGTAPVVADLPIISGLGFRLEGFGLRV